MSNRSAACLQVELPMVPLLDVSFQLMFFLVISFQFGGLEGRFALSLPTEGRPMPGSDHGAVAAQNPALELPSDLVVTIRADNGDHLSLSIRDAGSVVEVDDNQAFAEQLRGKYNEQPVGKACLLIEANARIKYSRLVEVLDAGKRAGFENISFAPPTER